jgi:hypothetical protein
LVDETGSSNVNVVYAFMGACCGLMCLALELGIPVRGAVTLGLATDALAGQLYGFALCEAHWLESRIAGHPRIVVGDELGAFLEGLRSPPLETTRNLQVQWKSTLAQTCLSLLAQDEDGVTILDYFGQVVQEMWKGRDTLREQMKKAIAFARQEHSRFAAAGTERNSEAAKLAGRYATLSRYLESRGASLP